MYKTKISISQFFVVKFLRLIQSFFPHFSHILMNLPFIESSINFRITKFYENFYFRKTMNDIDFIFQILSSR